MIAESASLPRATSDARRHEAIADTGSYVLEFEDVKYPLKALAARLEGAVVIRVKLENQGKVVGAERISGPEILARDCISSVKKWRFQPVPQKTAVVVYNFTMPGGLCKSTTSLMFLGPNLATVIGCDVPAEAAK
jgi:TonB family protein